MTLAEMITALEIEVANTTLWTDADWTRAVNKTVNLMSRMIPKRSIVEAKITREYTSETLVITTNTGTLAHKPVKKGSLTITGEVEGTDYNVNYLTGVVTEIGSLLADGNYTASYELDDQSYNLVEVSLTDYIKIESIEYPVGENPKATGVTFDVVGNVIVLRGKTTFTEDDFIRITYLEKWTPPATAAGNYPTHLDDVVIIGSVGQALLQKAEKYTQEAYTLAAATITVPTAYSFVKPTSPTLPSLPTAPTAAVIDMTTILGYLDSIRTVTTGDIALALTYLAAGYTLTNANNRGDNPAANDALLANAVLNTAQIRINDVIARIKQFEANLQLYASQVTAYGSSVNDYANQESGMVGKFREEGGI